MEIEIKIDHPWLILAFLLATIAVVSAVVNHVNPHEHHMGGTAISAQEEVLLAENDARRARQEKRVLEQQEEILRYQVQVLEAVLESTQDSAIQAELQVRIQELLGLLADKRKAEEHLLAALQQIWDAELRGGRAGIHAGQGTTRLQWPVEPIYGISAHFMDEEYEDIFGLSHRAIDIPIEQNSVIRSAGDGVVEDVVDNGKGYNFIIVRHEGVATLYGHVHSFLVTEGQTVRAGEPLALSGGEPGTPGAGAISTGPHLHLETIVAGEHTNPLVLLPQHANVAMHH